MILHQHTPAPPLQTFVERLWHCSDAPSHRRERILPSGTVELVINLRDDEVRVYDPSHPDRFRRYSGAVISGPYSGFFLIDPLQHAAMMGVHFRPGGAAAVLGVPPAELADTHLDLDQVWGGAARELRERLCGAATPTERISVLEAALTARLSTRVTGHDAVKMALALFERVEGSGSIRDVVRRVGLSHRRFIHLFSAEVGLTPKLYCRIRRFQRARTHILNKEAFGWAEAAVACGYYDQSHLIHDFHTFSGLTPKAYLELACEHLLPNHLPGVG